MSRTLTKEELIRSAWLVELRRQGHRQCHCVGIRDGKSPVCAIQLLNEIAKIESATSWHQIGRAAGLSTAQTGAVIQFNDVREMSFNQIAHEVETWFPGTGSNDGNPSRDR